MKNEILKNCILLTGPMSVGKSLISSELSKKIKMPTTSIDDIMAFVRDEYEGYIKPDPKSLENFRRNELEQELDIQKKKYPNKSIQQLTSEITALIDEYIEHYINLKEMVGSFEDFFPIYIKYEKLFKSIKSIRPDTLIAIVQDKQADFLRVLATKIKTPTIIDTPAHLGWKLPKFHFVSTDVEQLSKIGYNESPETIEPRTYEILSKFGPKICLQPGIDYYKRHNIETESHFIMTDMIDQYQEYADIEISTNNFFLNPDDDSLKNRKAFDSETNKKHELLKNKTEIENLLNAVIESLEELENAKQM